MTLALLSAFRGQGRPVQLFKVGLNLIGPEFGVRS